MKKIEEIQANLTNLDFLIFKRQSNSLCSFVFFSKMLSVILFLLFNYESYSQVINLVNNPSFEQNYHCPSDVSQINLVKDWFNINDGVGTPDYLHYCASVSYVRLPSYGFGFQEPKHGKAFVGIFTYYISKSDNNTIIGYEFVQTQLREYLKKDNQYYVSFYVNLIDNVIANIDKRNFTSSISKIGAYFSKKPIDYKRNSYIEGEAQVTSPEGVFLNDSVNWMKVSGTFKAEGDERYMVLGNFNFQNTQFFGFNGGNSSYYFLDDVAVYDCSALAHLGKNDTIYCQGNKQLKTTLDGASYLWQDGSTDSVFTAKESGLYWVEVSLAEGCKSRDSVYVHFTNEAPPFEIGKDTLLCAGQTYTLRAVADSSVLWQDGSKNTTYTVRQAGTYYAQAYKRGCLVSDTVHVRYDEAIIPQKLLNYSDTTLCSNEILTLSVNTQGSNLWYEWSNGLTSQNILVEETGTYRVSVITPSGCRYTEQISITFHDCIDFIPNVITPNDDGINETFEIQGIKADTWQLIIVNRWGKEVFKSDNYQNDWGKEAPEGVYYYHLRNLSIQKSWKGVISVLK
jgi:gliding motility-associated-like protein